MVSLIVIPVLLVVPANSILNLHVGNMLEVQAGLSEASRGLHNRLLRGQEERQDVKWVGRDTEPNVK